MSDDVGERLIKIEEHLSSIALSLASLDAKMFNKREEIRKRIFEVINICNGVTPATVTKAEELSQQLEQLFRDIAFENHQRN